MIKLSLNSYDVPTHQAPAFSSTLAAAVEAASAQPEKLSLTQAAVTQHDKVKRTLPPSGGLLSKGVRWLQQKGRSKKRLHMIETVSLGEKRFVALVKVDGREFLLGGAPSSVGMLADLGAHGLGELLSATTLEETKVRVAAPADAEPINVKEAAIRSVDPAPGVEVSSEVATPEAVLPMAVQQPVTKLVLETPAAPTPAAAVNISIDADEDEADWVLKDEMDDILKSAIEMEPTSGTASAPAASQTIVQSAPAASQTIVQSVPATDIAIVSRLGPIVVPAAVVPAAASTNSETNFNFTFQMWPTSPKVSSAAEVTTPASAAIGPTPVISKNRTHINLETCPELLGEPYVLALLDNAQGAAA